MIARVTLSIFCCLLFSLTKAQDGDSSNLVEKDFVIVYSSTNYESALKVAKNAAASLSYKLDLRHLVKHAETGLTLDKKTCDDEGYQFPYYAARGAADDGNYVSIEYSNAYNGFRENYYMVVVASGQKNTASTKNALKAAKKVFRDAYIKSARFYICCPD